MSLFFRFFLLGLVLLLSERVEAQTRRMEEQLQSVPDSITVGQLTVVNVFKYQLLAASRAQVASQKAAATTLLTTKVYQPYAAVWQQMSQAFGGAFQPTAFTRWNLHLTDSLAPVVQPKLAWLLTSNLDSLFGRQLHQLHRTTGRLPTGRWLIFFSPYEEMGLVMGGFDNQSMLVDLSDKRVTSETLQFGFPHELQHMIYYETSTQDPDKDSALHAVLDEGFASYAVYKYYNERVSLDKAIFAKSTPTELAWCLAHEREIFEKAQPYLLAKIDEKNALMCGVRVGNCSKLFAEAPSNLIYFLGFRIIQAYEKKHGRGTWKDVYTKPVREILVESGYAQQWQKVRQKSKTAAHK